MFALLKTINSSSALRWRAKLLWLTLLFIALEILSGFGLFFLKPFLANAIQLGQMHVFISWASLLIIWAYLISHCRRVKNYSATLHYRLGFLSMCAFIIVALSGAWIWLPKLDVSAMNLTHIVSGFGFMVLLAGHLTLVIRLALQRGR